MRVIIAGSRTITNLSIVESAVRESGFNSRTEPFTWIDEVVSGGAAGVDRLGEQWAEEWFIPIKRFPADWSNGRAAGPIRNGQMAEYADALIAIWDGESRGTADMIRQAEKAGLVVFVKRLSRRAAHQSEGTKENHHAST